MTEVRIDSYGHGGLGVGRVGGKVHFVEGALPGDLVEVEVVREKRSWARARTVSVIEPGPARRPAPCPHAPACGGCDLQHADEAAQREWKREVLADQLHRIAGLEGPPVGAVVAPGADFGYRNRMDFSVLGSRPALHRRSSSELVGLDQCLLLAPPLVELFGRLGDLTGASALTIRAGINTGDLLVVLTGDLPAAADEWGAAVCRSHREGTEVVVDRDHLYEEVAGRRFRITASAFFQNSTSGAEALVALVGDAVSGRTGRLVDLYAGGGLFACTVGGGFERVVAVEAAEPALSDLRANTLGSDVEIHADRVERLVIDGSGDTTVVVDPPRSGLGRDGVDTVIGLAPERLVYVSCEPASFARDVGYLGESGYALTSATPVDLFPQTHHIETVAILDR